MRRAFDESIRGRFGIVLSDQRGVGLSGGLTCPATAAPEFWRDAAGPFERQFVTGSGTIDGGNDRVVLVVRAAGRFDGRFRYVRAGRDVTVTEAAGAG